jgi:membrane-bound lytic murein transglycosylase A
MKPPDAVGRSVMSRRFVLLVVTATALSACSNAIIPRSPVVPSARPTQVAAAPIIRATPIAPQAAPSSAGSNARLAGVVAAALPSGNAAFDAASAGRALRAFRISCPSLIKRNDQSGLTQPADWKPACDAARDWADGDAPAFFAQQFELAQVGDGKAFATGYYEPEILGSRTRSSAYPVPVYKRPPELVEVDLGQFSDSLKGKKIRGRVDGQTFVPFADRTGIEIGALAGRGLEIAWAADAIDFFVLQIQGSGRLRLPDGSVMRIGYDGQNGRDYTGIGKLMKDRGLVGPGQTSMQGIESYLRANPEQGRAIMRENRSWVFFKEVTGAGPLGALGLPVSARASVATDPAFIPLGAPVLLSMDRADASGIWVAQDTGGAIKGSNRFDTFWGAGDSARATAGGMSARGTAFVFLPKGVVARVAAGSANVAPSAKR